MTASLALAVAASALLALVAVVVLPRSHRSSADLLPSPLRALHMVVRAVPLVVGDAPGLARHLRAAGRDDGPAGVRRARARSLVYCLVLGVLGLLACVALAPPPWLVPLVVAACGA